MIDLIPAVLVILIIALAYSLFILRDREKAAEISAIAAKAALALAVLAAAAEDAPVIVLLLALFFGAFLSARGFIPEGAGGEKRGRRDFVIFIVFIFILLAGGTGCAKKEIKMPEIKGSIKLSFIPSVVLPDEKNNGVYIGSERGRRVYFYDIASKKRKKTIKTGRYPADIVIGTHKIYIANKRSNTVTIFNTINEKSVNIRTGGIRPSAICVSTEEDRLYAANTGSSNVAIIDLVTNKRIKKIYTGKWPSDLYLAPDDKLLYVSCKYTNTVEIIDTVKKHHLFTKVDTGVSPIKIIPLNKNEIAILNEWEYAFNHKSTIIIFDTGEYALKRSIMVPGGISGGALSKSKKYLYISSCLREKLFFIDVESGKKVFELGMEGGTPKKMALSEDGGTLYVTAPGSKKIIMVSVNGLS